MKYISIDIETSGTDSQKNDVLSIGAIIEDTNNILPFEQIPKFKCIILLTEIVGHPRALDMNKVIIQLMCDYMEGDNDVKKLIEKNSGYKFFKKEEVIKEFYYFLYENGYGENKFINPITEGHYSIIRDKSLYPFIDGTTKPFTINVAGKNFGTFDKLFLDKLPWWQKLIRVRQRILDPAILFVDWEKDEALPSLDLCKERANIEGQVTHDCLEDAWDVILTLRKNYENNL